MQANRRFWLFTVAIMLLALLVRLYWITDMAWFSFDQATHLQAIYDLIYNGRWRFLALGPAMLDKQGLVAYLGPAYYWLLVPVQLVATGPWSAIIQVAVFGSLTAGLLSWLGRSWFSDWTGYGLGLAWAVNYKAVLTEQLIWNPSYLPFFSLVYLVAVTHYLKGASQWLLVICFVVGILSQLHGSGFLFIPLTLGLGAVAVSSRLKNWRQEMKFVLGGVGVFILTYLPYLARELIYKLENTHNLITLLRLDDPDRVSGSVGFLISRSINRFMVGYSDFILQQHYSVFVKLLLMIGLVTMIIRAVQISAKNRSVKSKQINCPGLLIWLISGFVLMASWFRYPIWDYFWLAIYPVVLLILAGSAVWLVSRLKPARWLILGLIVWYSLMNLGFLKQTLDARVARASNNQEDAQNILLSDQIAAVRAVMIDGQGQPIRVSYDTTYFYHGFRNNNAYDYLFKLAGAQRINHQSPHYLIVQPHFKPYQSIVDSGDYRVDWEKQIGYLRLVKLVSKDQ